MFYNTSLDTRLSSLTKKCIADKLFFFILSTFKKFL